MGDAQPLSSMLPGDMQDGNLLLCDFRYLAKVWEQEGATLALSQVCAVVAPWVQKVPFPQPKPKASVAQFWKVTLEKGRGGRERAEIGPFKQKNIQKDHLTGENSTL